MERHLSTDSAVLFNLITKKSKMKNCIILSFLLSLVAMTCLAIPAKRVQKKLTLADGSTVVATPRIAKAWLTICQSMNSTPVIRQRQNVQLSAIKHARLVWQRDV